MKDSKESLSKRLKRYGKKINYVITDPSVRERKERERKKREEDEEELREEEEEEKIKSSKDNTYHTKQRIKELKQDKKSSGYSAIFGFILIFIAIYYGSIGSGMFLISFEFIIGLIIIIYSSSRSNKLEDKIKDLEYELKLKS